MSLWIREFGSAIPRMALLAPADRYEAIVTAIAWTLDSLLPPADQHSPDVQLLTRYLDDARSVVGGDYTNRSLPEDVQEEMGEIIADDDDPGIGRLIIALGNCYGVPETGSAPEHLYTTLSDCYSAVVEREGFPQDESANPRCVATIAWQKKLIGLT